MREPHAKGEASAREGGGEGGMKGGNERKGVAARSRVLSRQAYYYFLFFQ